MVHRINPFQNACAQIGSPLCKQPNEILRLFLEHLPISDIRNLNLTCKAFAPLCYDQLLLKQFAIVAPNTEDRRSIYLALCQEQNMIKGTPRYAELGPESKDIWCLKIAGDKLVTGSSGYDKTCRIWDLKSLQCLKSLSGHTDLVQCLEIQEGKIYTGSSDKTCRVWDLMTGKCLGIFSGHQGSIKCLKLTDKYLITASTDKTCKLWDLKTFKCVHTFEPFLHPVHNLDVNQNILIACSYNVNTGQQHDCQAWNLHSKERVLHFEGNEPMIDVKVLETEFITVHSTTDDDCNHCQIWDLPSDSCKKAFFPEIIAISCIEVIGPLVVLGGANQWKSWNYQTNEVVASEVQAHHDIASMQVENGKVFTSSYWNNVTKIWDLKTGKCLRTLKLDTCNLTHYWDGIRCMKYEGGKIISGSASSPCRIWDFTSL